METTYADSWSDMQGSRYQSPLSPNAKKKYFWHKKCHLAKENVEKKIYKEKISIQI